MGNIAHLRARPTQEQVDHRTRSHYADAHEALLDALAVVEDLQRPGVLLVAVDELEFTTRRLRALLGGCIAAIEAAADVERTKP